MSDYSTVLYEPWHYVTLTNLIEPARSIAGVYPLESQRVAKANKEMGVGRTLFYNATPLAAAGVQMPWPGMGFAWAILSPLARRRPHVLHVQKAIEEGLADFIMVYDLKRIEAQVEDGFYAGQRWVQRIGFKFENDIPCYGPMGQDFKRYVIIGR